MRSSRNLAENIAPIQKLLRQRVKDVIRVTSTSCVSLAAAREESCPSYPILSTPHPERHRFDEDPAREPGRGRPERPRHAG
jgi:hypothetical protein